MTEENILVTSYGNLALLPSIQMNSCQVVASTRRHYRLCGVPEHLRAETHVVLCIASFLLFL